MSITTTPFFWFPEKAEEATQLYTSLIPESRIDSTHYLNADSPSGPAGSVAVISFTLAGRPYMAMGCPGPDRFNNAISITVNCDTQEEIDRIWDGLLDGGGSPMACGWLKDRFGLSWQITQSRMGDWIGGPDKEGAKRAGEAMMQMIKLDIATLEAAYKGERA